MYTYFFINYNDKTHYGHIQKYAKTNAILCFDFEDSIMNCIYPEKDSELKRKYRNYFKWIVRNIISQFGSIKIGLRINSNLSELQEDMNEISSLKISSILVPKAESSDQIKNIKQLLLDNKVIYDEIIPIIESPKGISQLPGIIQSNPDKINKIGFGHCDYNLSSGIFPFFHQNSREYWKWIKKMGTMAIPGNMAIINSAFLELENHTFFQAMLCHLHELFGENFGQFTLTMGQTAICNTYQYQKNRQPFNNLLDSRLDLGISELYADQLINKFENENNNRGFTVLIKERILISPHEYLSAKRHKAKTEWATVHFTFAGGCFPVQYNILFEDLFHQKLRKKIENLHNVNLSVNIIRYERFNTCLDKIAAYHKINPVDILVFHIRPEPFLRLVKFYYKFLNNEGKLKHSLNIPFLKIIHPEKYDLLILGRRFGAKFPENESKSHKMLVNLNYITGNFFGNTKFALKKYFELITGVIKYCQGSNIKLLLLGPALRSNTSYEPFLCRRLDDYMHKMLKNFDLTYINGLDSSPDDCESFFHSNGIHATERYHDLIAEKLYNILKHEIEFTRYQTLKTTMVK